MPKKILKKRDILRENLKTALNSSEFDVAKIQRLLVAIELTYKFPPSEMPRLAFWDLYLPLTRIYAAQN
jgi:hypothetical protein